MDFNLIFLAYDLSSGGRIKDDVDRPVTATLSTCALLALRNESRAVCAKMSASFFLSKYLTSTREPERH